jgi:hypothetical protein
VAQSLSFRKNIITRPGDKEVKGVMAKWKPGINTLEAAIERDKDSARLRHHAEPEEKGRVRR